MSESNVPLITMMSLTVGLTFGAMIMSAISARSVAADCKCTDDTAHSYATYTAVTCGLSSLLIAIALGFYIYRKEAIGVLSNAIKTKSA